MMVEGSSKRDWSKVSRPVSSMMIDISLLFLARKMQNKRRGDAGCGFGAKYDGSLCDVASLAAQFLHIKVRCFLGIGPWDFLVGFELT